MESPSLNAGSQARLEEFATEKREASALGILEEWLQNNFRVEGTRENYRKAMLAFVTSIYMDNIDVDEGVERYLKEERDFLHDLKNMVKILNSKGLAPGTINLLVTCVKLFFEEHGHEISKKDWRTMKRLLPPRDAVTQDKILRKEGFRSILDHLPINGRAIALLLLSSGGRIGETLKLQIEDLDLDADPPEVRFRAPSTKKGVGGRIVWMSYEARDAIREWLKIKDKRCKPSSGEPYRKDMVFDITNYRRVWNRALKKAELDKRDSTTQYHLYHVHTLRKFFNSQMKLAGVHGDIVQGWMGHKPYMFVYDKFPKEDLTKIYKDHMAAVSIYVSDEETKQSQQIIKEDDLESYLAAGWTFKATLPSAKIVVEGKPGMLRPTPPELGKSEAVSPTQVTQNMPVVKKEEPPPTQDVRSKTEPPQATQSTQSLLAQKIQRGECLRDLETTQWDLACAVCRERHKNYYEKCAAPFKDGKGKI